MTLASALTIMWVSGCCLLLFAIIAQSAFYAIVSFATGLFFYSLIPFTGDVRNSYLNLIKSYDFSTFEPLSAITFLLVSNFFNQDVGAILLVWSTCVFCLTYFATVRLCGRRLNTRKKLLVASIIMFSSFGFLGTENVIRQGFAAALLLFLISFRWMFLLALLSPLFHYGNIIFLSATHGQSIIDNTILKRTNRYAIFFMSLPILYILLSSLDLSAFVTRNSDRDLGAIKIIAQLSYVVIFQVLAQKASDTDVFKYFCNVRLLLLACWIVVSIVSNTEMSSRIFFYFYAIDVVLVAILATDQRTATKPRVMFFVIFMMSSAFNPGIINLIEQGSYK